MLSREALIISARLCLWLLLPGVSGYLSLFPRDGAVSDLTGFPGVAYQAIHYEPLCGNLGTDTRYSAPWDITGRCAAAMDSFGNNTEKLVAIYDATGTRLENGIVGNGYDTCICFALSQLSGELRSALCLWVNGAGQNDVWWSLSLDHVLAGVYRPNIDKALPLCKDIDLAAAKSSWSETAAHAEATEDVNTDAVVSGGSGFVTSTYTNSENVLTTSTITISGESPEETNTTSDDGGLSRSDKIAIGVGLGLGIPTIVLMLIGLCLQCR